MEEGRARSHTVTTTTSSYSDTFTTTASFSYDRNFLATAPGLLLLAEISLCFYGSAFVLYLIAAVVDATSITKEILDNHNYNSWTSSAFFAFLVTVCYAVSTYFSFRSWRIQS
ncbi:CKLF-like MARVEL transmembrane domain-containing protein 8 isoform X3 [Aquarana catesbeiana]|uniref:CKLF-like MARVEL transmembrane domain-containing protein 8 isoform X3 n=1 Tax=Aquarana catesbeiana TaxID=8400 RepID=UPI003CC94B87